MLSDELRTEAERQFKVCNACRYCEGYCAVFPAMEVRRTFTTGDVEYIGNLCHDCRDCYYACQYAPPHAFAVNIPRLLSTVRTETYATYAPPPGSSRTDGRGAWNVLWIALATLVLGFVLVLGTEGAHALVQAHLGPGAFYRVIPAAVMEIIFSALGLFWLLAWTAAGRHFWGATAAPGGPARVSAADLWHAAGDALKLRYLGGGGAGCTYPQEAFSELRRVLHHLVVYGFALDLVSTSVAAFDDHVLGRLAPYPVGSPVVLLGALGGVGILVGTIGLLLLKARADGDPAHPPLLRMDAAFLVALLLVAATGMVLMVLRSTALMGTLLIIHLATVAALFLTAPYGKFVHLVYRYAALVRFAHERGQHAG